MWGNLSSGISNAGTTSRSKCSICSCGKRAGIRWEIGREKVLGVRKAFLPPHMLLSDRCARCSLNMLLQS